jgi:dTDP-4-dehydrorhamnose reductase
MTGSAPRIYSNLVRLIMNKILVTGSTGLLGSSLVPHLKKRGYEVIAHARATQADFMFNLADRVKSYQVLAQMQPNVIINLAGLTSVELCEKEVNLAYLANTRTVENVSAWVEGAGVDCHLVQISTDHVYDGVGLHREDDITIRNNYAFSKYAGELAAIRVPSTILRTNFVGRSKVGHRESLTDWIYRSLIGGEHVQVLSDVYFSPLSMVILVEMIEVVVKMKLGGIYNLGSHCGMSKADFAFAFAECLKLPTNVMTSIESGQAAFLKTYRPKDMRMDCTKFENAFGVKLPNLSDLIQPLAEEYNEIA